MKYVCTHDLILMLLAVAGILFGFWPLGVAAVIFAVVHITVAFQGIDVPRTHGKIAFILACAALLTRLIGLIIGLSIFIWR